jgi:hypothetical protein
MSHTNPVNGWQTDQFDVYWTGWKPRASQDLLVGQWIASPLAGEGHGYYITVPYFLVASFCHGYEFNLTGRGQHVTSRTSEDRKNGLVREGAVHMRALLALAEPMGAPFFHGHIFASDWPDIQKGMTHAALQARQI